MPIKEMRSSVNWLDRLEEYTGKPIVLIVEDTAGQDPAAPAVSKLLDHVAYNAEGTHLQFYFNALQFLAVPVFPDERTHMEGENLFLSCDEEAKLLYKVRFEP